MIFPKALRRHMRASNILSSDMWDTPVSSTFSTTLVCHSRVGYRPTEPSTRCRLVNCLSATRIRRSRMLVCFCIVGFSFPIAILNKATDHTGKNLCRQPHVCSRYASFSPVSRSPTRRGKCDYDRRDDSSGTVNVTVSATDASGIASVTLFVDGVKVAGKTSSPFNFGLNSNNWTKNVTPRC